MTQQGVLQAYDPTKPIQLTYVGPRLKGQATQFQQWQIYPLSSNQYWQTNAIVKIQANASTGLIDWYRTHIQFQVQIPVDYMPVGGAQVDISAYSAISQVVLQQQNFQIQRIMQHDVLLAYLVDVGFSQLVCANRQGQGLGYTNIPTQAAMSSSMGQGSLNRVPTVYKDNTNTVTFQNYYQINNKRCYSPTIMPLMQNGVVGSWKSSAPVNQMMGSVMETAGIVPSHQSATNPVSFPQFLTVPASGLQNKVQTYHRFHNVRAQYKYACQKNDYPDTPDSLPLCSPFIKNQTWTYNTFLTKGYDKNNPYELQFRDKAYITTTQTTNNIKSFQVGGCGITGYSKPLAPDFCKGNFQPIISPTIPQAQMSYGVILNTPIPVQRKRFRIPLASAICGIFIPPDQFRLFPAQFYNGLLLQLTMNKHFMFTTGYSDVHQCDSIGMSYPIPRKWKYNQIKWVWHLYSINDYQLAKYVQNVMYKQIRISSRYWQLLCQFQLPSGSYVKQTNQIPCNVQSLTQVVILFLSNQYLTYTGARKQFRLSNNMTSMQLRANTVFYPSQPIIGNAGCPSTIDQTGDNWNYIQPIYLSNSYLFVPNVPAPRMNCKNFAINGRLHDTTNTKTLYASTLFKNTDTDNDYNNFANFTLANINADTAMGQSWFHQNRYRGTAAFVYSFQPYGHSRTLVNGVNTLGWKQFQIMFNNSTINQFPYDQSQYIFGQCNVMLILSKNRPVQVLGV